MAHFRALNQRCQIKKKKTNKQEDESPEKQIAGNRVSVVFQLCMFFIIFSE